MMKGNKRLSFIFPAILAVFILGGCALWSDGTRTGEIDPPPQNGSKTNANTDDAEEKPAMADLSGPTMEITGYFADPNGLVAPISMRVPFAEGTAAATLAYMVEGGPGEAMLPPGFRALIPKGTHVQLDITEDGTAVVDFSDEFASYNAQDERKILEAVTWALTEFERIDRVSLRLKGRPLTEMPVNGMPVAAALTRSTIGINLERAKGADFGQSTPVTLYFQSSTDDGYAYFVPVTRLIPRTDNPALAAVHELIKGPMNRHLSGVITPAAEVLDLRKQDDVLQINLNDAVLTEDLRTPQESIQSVILSLTETTGLAKVQILVNGSAEVWSTDEQLYDMPATQPAHLNKVGL
jgi:germination protein M